MNAIAAVDRVDSGIRFCWEPASRVCGYYRQRRDV